MSSDLGELREAIRTAKAGADIGQMVNVLVDAVEALIDRHLGQEDQGTGKTVEDLQPVFPGGPREN